MRPRLVLAEPDAPPFDHGCSTAAPSSELEALFRRHQGWLLALLRFRYGADAAEDLLQETFLRAARRPEKVAEVRHPRAWLATLAVSAARDRHRRHQVRAHVNEAPGDDVAPPTGSHQDEALLLKQVILSLPPHLKDTFVLSRFANLTYSEIAEHQQIPVKTVEWRITKAMKLISVQLRGQRRRGGGRRGDAGLPGSLSTWPPVSRTAPDRVKGGSAVAPRWPPGGGHP